MKLVLGSKPEIFLVGIAILSFFTVSAWADDSGSILLETDQQEYKIGDLMVISGFIEEKRMPVVALKIFDPNGGILSANQVDIEDDNTFYKTIALDSPFYDEEGIYSITMNYGQLETETNFEMVNDSSEDSVSDDDFSFLFPEILAMFTDKEIYEDGDTVSILGLVSEKDAPSVLIGIYDPFGTPAGFYFADVDNDLEFTTSFLVKAGVNFKTEGFYSITAFYGDSEVITSFEYTEKIETVETPIIDNDDDSNDVDDSISDSSSIDKKTLNNIPKAITSPVDNLNKDKKTITPTKNLSVEDIELGIMLNQINLRCDTSEFVDTISYYDSMGPALIRLCKYDEAIFYYDQSLIQDPNNVEILTNKGSALSKMGFYQEAIIHYDSALAIDKNYYLALNNKGNALANLGIYDEAILSYNKALDSAPSNSVVLTNLEKAKEKLVVFEIDSQKSDNSRVLEHEDNLVSSSNQQETSSIFDQIGNMFSSLFNFLS
jgi:tetratricopeptide (TPR) repeat protein